MHLEQLKKTKRPSCRPWERPFPWHCHYCGKREVTLEGVSYLAEVRHNGHLHTFTIAELELPMCQACNEPIFTEKVDTQINAALRTHLNLLTPAQIRDAIKRIGMPQKDLVKCLGITEEQLFYWLSETQIQSQAMDNFLRAFFAFPQLRAALCGKTQDSKLGLSDVASGSGKLLQLDQLILLRLP